MMRDWDATRRGSFVKHTLSVVFTVGRYLTVLNDSKISDELLLETEACNPAPFQEDYKHYLIGL